MISFDHEDTNCTEKFLFLCQVPICSSGSNVVSLIATLIESIHIPTTAKHVSDLLISVVDLIVHHTHEACQMQRREIGVFFKS